LIFIDKKNKIMCEDVYECECQKTRLINHQNTLTACRKLCCEDCVIVVSLINYKNLKNYENFKFYIWLNNGRNCLKFV